MIRPAAPRRRLAPPRALLGMLGLVLAIELFLDRHFADFADPIASDWRQSGRVAGGRARDCEVLCFGDSQVKLGVAPRVIEARSGRAGHNLALIGGQAPSAYFLLRRALEAGARPSAVVVDFMPNLLFQGPEYNARHWPQLLDLREGLDLARTARDPDLFARVALGRLLPSYPARDNLRASLIAALGGQAKAEERRREAQFHVRNWRVNRGAMIMPPYPNRTDPVLWYHVNFPRPWECDRVNLAYVCRFLALAGSRGVRVFWLLPPIDPDAQVLCERRGQEARFEAFLRNALDRHPNLSIVDARHSGYGRDVLLDAVHLNYRGAYALSADLAAVLRRGAGGGGPRWVELPAYRARVIDVPMEDLSQSNLAILQREATRR
jgi:hypothetical protein